MGWFSGVVVYICIWWTVIFCTLPLWVKRDESGPEVTAHGAPEDPMLKKKFLITTIISAVIWVIAYILIDQGIIDFRGIAENMSNQDYN
jgi:predicted secreted protein